MMFELAVTVGIILYRFHMGSRAFGILYDRSVMDAPAEFRDFIRRKGCDMHKGQIKGAVVRMTPVKDLCDIHIRGDSHIGIGLGAEMLELCFPGIGFHINLFV
jgi:hypothetical protein